jgi:hypothetical protein
MSTKCKENVSNLLNLHHQHSDLLTLLFSPARKAFPFKNECLTNLQFQVNNVEMFRLEIFTSRMSVAVSSEQRRNVSSRNIHTCHPAISLRVC